MLSDVKVRQTKATGKAYKLADSNGLCLEVKPNGAKHWRYRYRIAGKENVFAIGEYPQVSLQDARKAREDARELVKQGIHPAHARQKRKMEHNDENAVTFELVAREWLAKKAEHWTPYYHKQATNCLEKNAYPKIGHEPIRSIRAADLLEIMQDMEARGAETYALHLRQWCSAIFRYAVVTLRADSDPAAALKGAIIRPKINHCRAMQRSDIQDFLCRLDGYGGNLTTVIILRLLLYLFVRTVELRKSRWSEFDLVKAEWLIPAERMKMRRPHLVPLPAQAVELLTVLHTVTGSNQLLFPNFRRPTEAMSPTTVNRALEHMGYPTGVWTGHDFRATASTRLHEMGFLSAIIERQLAHVEGNKVKAAYNHAEYQIERRSMMQAWADWIDAASD
jgi:integrase